jgi:endoglucanase
MHHNRNFFLKISFLLSCFALAACSGGNSENYDRASFPIKTLGDVQENELIKLNQIGFLPGESKLAIVPATATTSFEVVNMANNSVVLSATLSNQSTWSVAGDEVRIADFSALTEAGKYILRVSGFADSSVITINNDAYLNVHDAALKAYYFNRASTELVSAHAGLWSRLAGHPDTSVLVHKSASDSHRPTGTVLSAPRGWYDAGDYNKYVVNSGISMFTLLAAYEQYPDFYRNRDVNIPESGDAIPDILDEVKWNLDWMLAMQDPHDGGVYHKLTSLKFSGAVMPNAASAERYVVQKSTSAALNFAAVMAKASSVYRDFEQFEALSQLYKEASVNAWRWAQKNPNVAYRQPSDVSTGIYGDDNFDDERLWAAAELFMLTQDAEYLGIFNQLSALSSVKVNVPSWRRVATLAYISLLAKGETLMPQADYDRVKSVFLGLADTFLAQSQASAYAVAMEPADFVWGGNAVALNKAMILLNAFSISGNANYKKAATGLLDYTLGRNPVDYSFVTGHGVKTPMDPHHRQSYADTIKLPVPGFLVGGPQPGQQDGCSYPSSLPAKSYLDNWCSFSSNEVTINWNAPLVYTLAALHNSQ